MRQPRPFPRPARREALLNIIIPVGFAVGAFLGMVGQDGGGGGETRCSEDPARLESPGSLSVDAKGDVIVVQKYARCVTRVAADGTVTRLAGELGWPSSVAAAPDGTVYVGDRESGRILRVTEGGRVTQVTRLQYASLADLALDGDGNIITGSSFGGISRVTPAGAVRSLGGGGSDPVVDGASAAATAIEGRSVAVDADGNVYATTRNQVARIGRDGRVTLVAGTGQEGFAGDGGPATKAKLARPEGLAVAPDGTVYIADTENYRVRAVSPDGVITTVAGTGSSSYSDSGDGGPAVEARLTYPTDLVWADGELFVSESYRNVVRVIRADGTIGSVGVR